ncbi:hypothetical protein THAOC_06170 [Thalassiosira oceanica]|uniref:Uncharacterized protein n=1 Tax=Thalassiosira oceanica TaxID=159749 RepID=K0T3M8_THAOC|nr:hypothetical protein THAOC_06170 [Thalassiosira oceanica]|eukprot:EJK72310.1 hypothetical protein THAOC_06170 [Thalassiosira oceanica]
MTFRRDWRRQGGCRRHSGGCRVSAACPSALKESPEVSSGSNGRRLGRRRRAQADQEEERDRDTAASPGRKRFPRTPTADEVSVATGAGKLALRSLFASMSADADDDDDDSLLTIPDAAGGGSSERWRGDVESGGRRNARRGLFVDQRRRRDGVGLLRNGQAGTRLPPRAVESRRGMKRNESLRVDKYGPSRPHSPREVSPSAQSLDDKDLFGSFTLDGLDKEQNTKQVAGVEVIKQAKEGPADGSSSDTDDSD